MKVEVRIPPIEDVLAGHVSVPLAPRGVSWSEASLGSHAKDFGVYVIHHSGTVKYVGKTDGPSMSYGMRLRREFQETAAQGRHIYPKLAALDVPPDIRAYFLPSNSARELVSGSGISLSDPQRITILEAVLIQAYEPEFQR